MMDLETRLRRAGRILDDAATQVLSSDRVRDRSGLTIRVAAAFCATAVIVAAVVLIDRGGPDPRVDTASAPSGPAWVDVSISATATPASGTDLEVYDPRWESRQLSDVHEVTVLIAGSWENESAAFVQPWSSTDGIVVGNRNVGCEPDGKPCNGELVPLKPTEVGTAIPLFIDFGSLRVGRQSIQTTVRSGTESVQISVVIDIEDGDPLAPNATETTVTTRP